MDEKHESPLNNVKKSIFGSGKLLLFSDKTTQKNAFKMPHDDIDNCSSVVWVLGKLQPLQPEEKSKQKQTAIVLPELSLSQGWYSF